jgi:putative tricarboxylic transport membrane protein
LRAEVIETIFAMKKLSLIPFFWLAIATYFALAAHKLGLGAAGQPGAGFFPFGAALAIGVIALVRLLRASGEIATFATSRAEWGRIFSVIASMALYALLLEPLGFALCTFLLIAAYLRLIAEQSWPRSLRFAAAVAILSQLFFDSLLGAPLPRGPLAALL